LVKVFGNFTLKGGFEVTSKHDLLTAIMSILVLAGIVGLTMTGHDHSTAMAALLAGLGGLFSYWFARGGSAIAQNNQPTTSAVSQDITTQVANGVVQGIQTATQTPAQTPAQGSAQNAAGTQG